LVLRHLEPLTAADAARLKQFGQNHRVQWWLQPKGPETVHLLDAQDPQVLSYALPDFQVIMPFKPTDFTQVNPHINRVLVGQALQWLDPKPHERIIDWFCGLGNFTLPIARRCAEVLGIEGSATLVERAQRNAASNGLAAKATFAARDLFGMTPEALVADGSADAWLVDPPREGAFALVKALADIASSDVPNWTPPKRIVYVSCNPATLARDAGLLVHQAGYRCVAAGVINMFPHTAHVESMAVFERF
jgi:23S rRNA (uracil1939-C5)-methyltransferase